MRKGPMLWLLTGLLATGVLAAVVVASMNNDSTPAAGHGSSSTTLAEAGSGPPLVRGATAAACATDRETMQAAEDGYFAFHRAYADEATLVSQQFLKTASSLHDIVLAPGAASYTSVPAPGSGCP